MKNLVSLVTREEIHDFVKALWKSDLFRNSHGENGYIYDQVERFAYLPRLFAEETYAHLERAHFCTWWNVIMIRDFYENPIIHDLYLLHEMTHAATMPYIPNIGRAAFDEKMQRNELEASVLSEIAVYLEMDGLREKSFSHPIYADRFLDDPQIKALWGRNNKVAVETLRFMRRHIMTGGKPDDQMDLTEVWIKRFADQNETYSIIWSDRYNEVEERMAMLQMNAVEDRAEALRLYRLWLECEAARDQIDNIPFREEAELFAGHYWTNKAKYQAAMERAA